VRFGEAFAAAAGGALEGGAGGPSLSVVSNLAPGGGILPAAEPSLQVAGRALTQRGLALS
jgi:hypothetical protein